MTCLVISSLYGVMNIAVGSNGLVVKSVGGNVTIKFGSGSKIGNGDGKEAKCRC